MTRIPSSLARHIVHEPTSKEGMEALRRRAWHQDGERECLALIEHRLKCKIIELGRGCAHEQWLYESKVVRSLRQIFKTLGYHEAAKNADQIYRDGDREAITLRVKRYDELQASHGTRKALEYWAASGDMARRNIFERRLQAEKGGGVAPSVKAA